MTLLDEPELVREVRGSGVGKGRWGLYLLRAGAVGMGLGAWFGTQAMIGSRAAAGGSLPIAGDGVLVALTGVHDYLWVHVAARNGLLIASSAVIDVLAVFMLVKSIFGGTFRPFLGLLILFGLRQIFQGLCVLPMPAEMIWPKEGPGFPSLLVTYGVGNDLFFSGHTALAVFGAVELGRVRRWLVPVGVMIVVFEAGTVLALRAHWTMDVYAGAVSAVMVAYVVNGVGPGVDRVMERVAGVRGVKRELVK